MKNLFLVLLCTTPLALALSKGPVATFPIGGDCCQCSALSTPGGTLWTCPCSYEVGGVACVITLHGCDAIGICPDI